MGRFHGDVWPRKSEGLGLHLRAAPGYPKSVKKSPVAQGNYATSKEGTWELNYNIQCGTALLVGATLAESFTQTQDFPQPAARSCSVSRSTASSSSKDTPASFFLFFSGPFWASAVQCQAFKLALSISPNCKFRRAPGHPAFLLLRPGA